VGINSQSCRKTVRFFFVVLAGIGILLVWI